VWYKAATSLNEIDEIAKTVSEMKPYDTHKHLKMLFQKPDLHPFDDDSIDDKIKALHDLAATSRNYLNLHPQIYLYPKESHDLWRYLLYDPKDLKRIDDPDYYQDLATPHNLSKSLEDVYDWAHSRYPTALIDHYLTEEEMLKG